MAGNSQLHLLCSTRSSTSPGTALPIQNGVGFLSSLFFVSKDDVSYQPGVGDALLMKALIPGSL